MPTLVMATSVRRDAAERLTTWLVGYPIDMRLLVIPLLLIIGTVVLIGFVMWSRPRTRPRRDEQPEFPLPVDGETSAPIEHEHPRPDGSPVPGSQEDRKRHGKP